MTANNQAIFKLCFILVVMLLVGLFAFMLY